MNVPMNGSGMSETTKTLCPYCGVGCGLEMLPPAQSGKPTTRSTDGVPIWQVRGDRAHPSSQGMVCVKGATIAESLHKDRLRYPMMRRSLSDPFERVSWDTALETIVEKIQTIRATDGADAVCMYGSGQFQTEDYYIAQKLMKGCLGTNNFDANSRLCMSSAVSGYIQSFGADGPPCCYEDLDLTDCAFLIGTNTAECHPILFNRFRKRHKQNRAVKLIVVDPRLTQTAKAADLHLAINPGTDIDLLHGMAHYLMSWCKIDPEFIDECTDGFLAFAEIVRYYTPEVVSRRCGISIADLEKAARWWSESERVLSLWSMGINQSSEGTAKVRSIINLHLMTGQVGKPGAGPFSLTGQPNAMGGREAGGLSHLLPGYRSVLNPQHRTDLEAFWDVPTGRIAAKPGRTIWETIEGLESGEVKMIWVAATNPVVSLPDLERTKAAFQRSPFTVYQEAYFPTEMSAYAHLLLPAAQFSEKSGIMVNSERRVTLCSAFRSPPGEARPDWEIFAEVGRRLGFAQQFAFNSAAEVYAEFVQITQGRPCDQSGLSHAHLKAEGPKQWPYSKTQTVSSERLYTDLRFHTVDGRAKFAAHHSRGLAEPPDDRYPFVLTNGRLYGHWHTQTRTGRIPKIREMHPHPFLEIHPRDAVQVGVDEGDWIEVRSRRGYAKFPVVVTKGIAPGTVFVPMHWGSLWADQAEANAMMHPESCPDSKQPELKACAVQLIPLSLTAPSANFLSAETLSV
jgi:ferredoxin-nitrate reductase